MDLDKKKKIHIVYSQTGYTEKEAENNLIENEWDVTNTIRQYNGVSRPETASKSTTMNQAIYRELRTFMDSIDNTQYQR